MNKKPKIALVTIGVLSIIFGVLGLLYNAGTLFTDFSQAIQENDQPYFYPAFYTMSAICITCYLVLLFIGVCLIRLNRIAAYLLPAVLIFEVIYFLSLGALWLIPNLGPSIAAATGVANGGLMFQFLTLFPIWASIIALWAAGKIRPTKIQQPPQPSEPPPSDDFRLS